MTKNASLLDTHSVPELSAEIDRRNISPVELVRESLDRAEALNGSYNSMISICRERALLMAEAAERRAKAGARLSDMDGIPITAKDLIMTVGVATTNGSGQAWGEPSDRNAPVMAHLERAGAVLVGKNNLHELAMGISNDNPHFGRPVNPWDRTCSPGGSSGGSAVAVALGIGAGSVGTDTGGSIRVPAASCGVFGLKPTKGYVSTEGVTGVSWTLDHVGPLASRAEDVDAMLRAMVADPDPAVQRTDSPDLRGKRLGVPRSYFDDWLEPQVSEAYAAARASFERLGVTLVEIDMPVLNDIVELAFDVSKVEAGYNHGERFGAHPDEIGQDIREALVSAAAIPASVYVKAMQRQRRFGQVIEALFADVDAIITPTLPASAKPYGTEKVVIDGRDIDFFECMIHNTCIFNTSGHPALTIPFPVTSGLPVGIQIVGPWRSEATLLTFAKAYQDEELHEYFASLAKLRQSAS